MFEQLNLESKSFVPKYIQIIDAVIQNITLGILKKGDKLPSINKLSEEYYLSRDTVEKAYGILKKRKVIISIQGKGSFVAKTKLISRLNVLFLVNKLSPYKMCVYNAFLKALDTKSHVDLHSYHCDENLFLELIEKYKGAYDYYVIMPHFRNDNLSYMNFTDSINEAINKIPKEQLVILDNNKHNIEGNYIGVYQDFEKDIFTALELAKGNIEKYKKINIIFPKKVFYPYPKRILDGFLKFCHLNKINFEVKEQISTTEPIEKQTLYITIEDDDLVALVNKSRVLNYKLGKDIGIISYNDTSLKQLLGITVITTNFDAMGTLAAQYILDNKKEKVNAPFSFIERESA